MRTDYSLFNLKTWRVVLCKDFYRYTMSDTMWDIKIFVKKYLNNLLCYLFGHNINVYSLELSNKKECLRCSKKIDVPFLATPYDNNTKTSKASKRAWEKNI